MRVTRNSLQFGLRLGNEHLENLGLVLAVAHGAEDEVAPGDEFFAEAFQVLGDVFRGAEVGHVEHVGAQAFDQVDGAGPGFKVDVGRWCGWAHVVYALQTYTGGVSGEEFARVDVEENDVMHGVSRGVMDLQATTGNVEDGATFENFQAILRDWLDLAPVLLHALLAVDAGGAGYNFRCVDQVRHTFAVCVDFRVRHALDERASCSCMIQVDVGGDDVGDLLRVEAHIANAFE